MKLNPHEDLVAYLFDEAEEQDRLRIEDQLNQSEFDRDTLDRWKETRRALDAWQLDVSTPKKSSPEIPPLIKLAASVVFLIGIGFLLGRMPQNGSPDREAWRQELQREIAHRVAVERQEWEHEQHALQARLLVASGHATHGSASGFAQKTIESLRSHDSRNSTLALLLPPEEQAKYFAQRERFEKVAEATDREVQKTRENLYHIIARATPRAEAH